MSLIHFLMTGKNGRLQPIRIIAIICTLLQIQTQKYKTSEICVALAKVNVVSEHVHAYDSR